ncbi:TPA: hypothetical protein ACNUWQ_003031 [Aeromonas salmonicida]|jgi:hypothetical protein
MTTQPAHLCFNQAIREEYRKTENAFDQMTNVVLGVFRFTTTFVVHALAALAAWILCLLSVAPDTLTPLSPLIEARVEHSAPFDEQTLPTGRAMPLDIIERAEEPTAVSDIDAVSEPIKVLRPYPESSYVADPQEEAHALLKNLLLSAVLVAFLVGVTCNTGRFTWVYRDRAWARVHTAQQQRELLDLCRLAATKALALHRESTLIKGQEVA